METETHVISPLHAFILWSIKCVNFFDSLGIEEGFRTRCMVNILTCLTEPGVCPSVIMFVRRTPKPEIIEHQIIKYDFSFMSGLVGIPSY